MSIQPNAMMRDYHEPCKTTPNAASDLIREGSGRKLIATNPTCEYTREKEVEREESEIKIVATEPTTVEESQKKIAAAEPTTKLTVEESEREENEKKLAAAKIIAPAVLRHTEKLRKRKEIEIAEGKSIPNPLTETSIELRQQEAMESIQKYVRDADLHDLVRDVQAHRILLSEVKLRELMSKIKSPEHVFSRAIVYNMLLQVLIAVSIKEKFKEDESILRSESIQETEWERLLTKAMEDKLNFWCEENTWLLREVEEDDDLMSNIMSVNGRFAVLNNDGVRRKIDSLELVGRMVKSYLENHIIDPILEKLPRELPEDLPEDLPEEVYLKFLNAKVMIVKGLIDRSCKAGARLLWMIMRRSPAGDRPNFAANQPIFRLVKEVFLGHPHMVGIFWMPNDQYEDKGEKVSELIKGKDIFMGKLHDDHLLCWATRRDYSDLIHCIMQYERVSKCHPKYDAAHDESIILSWKYAVWTATHFENWQALQYLLAWTDLDVHGYGLDRGLEEWLPPLHMVALMGDWKKMKLLFYNIKGLQTNTRDHRGRMPLELAMQGNDPAQTIWTLVVMSQDVGKHLQELYNMYINHANAVLIGASIIASVAFVGWLQPPLGYVDDYVAIDGHKSIGAFVIFNCLAFFLAVATMLVGAEATLYVHDKDDKHVIVKDMRSSLKWMIGFFLGSIVCFMGAYISAGIAVLPPFTWSMVVSIIVGGGACLIPLFWILRRCTKRSILPFVNAKDHQRQLGNSNRYDNQSLQQLRSIQHQLDHLLREILNVPPTSLVLQDYYQTLLKSYYMKIYQLSK